MKSIEDHFADWESEVFGLGYGTGEVYIIPVLKSFLLCIPADAAYDYRRIEKVCEPIIAWLMINALCKAGIIEYGTSPRFGWLTDEGKSLKSFVIPRSNGFLLQALDKDLTKYVGCDPDHCNCADEVCHNPFWKERPDRTTYEDINKR